VRPWGISIDHLARVGPFALAETLRRKSGTLLQNNCTGWAGRRGFSGRRRGDIPTTFSSTFPCPTTRSSAFGGREYTSRQPGLRSHVDRSFVITVRLPRLTWPPRSPGGLRSGKPLVKQGVPAQGAKNQYALNSHALSSPIEFSNILNGAVNCSFSNSPRQARPALENY